MAEPTPTADTLELEATFWHLYRDFFDKAEKKRRWSIRDDIPWEQTNARLPAAVADVVESFCAVELYLPDYTSKILPVVRSSRGRSWFYANWGYEESKHSLALGDWLLKSGQRTDEQMADLEANIFKYEWNLPHESRLGMIVYAMTQELATWLSYRNLRLRVEEQGGDPALVALLKLVAIDERAHYDFFQECVQIYLKHNREETLEQLRNVLNHFAMPMIHAFADSRRRVAGIRELDIMSEDIYFADVYRPILQELGVSRGEMRQRVPVPKSKV